jgi:predicted enzyme related to lactoylglutathione lyase
VIYTHKTEEMSAFYTRHFGYSARQFPGHRITELCAAHGGPSIMLHAAVKGQKQGQVLVKLVFKSDVAADCARLAAEGLQFGPIHQAGPYAYANAKDPSGNSISLSSRAFAPPPEAKTPLK